MLLNKLHPSSKSLDSCSKLLEIAGACIFAQGLRDMQKKKQQHSILIKLPLNLS